MGLEEKQKNVVVVEQNKTFCFTFSYSSNLQDVTNSITEVPEVAVQVSERRAALHLCVGRYVLVWGNGCTRCILTQHWVNFIKSLIVLKVSVDVKQH